LLKTEPCILLNYQQYTKHAETAKPMHAENGFWKVFNPGADGVRKVQASFSHPFSLNEFEHGSVGQHEGRAMITMSATTENFQRPAGAEPQAKMTTAVKREFWLDQDNCLNYKLYLGVNGAEPYHHLSSKLCK